MTLAPFAMTGRTEAELARAMAEHLQGARPASGAEALPRAAPRLSELAADARVTALARADAAANSYIPR